jgi:tetratricopeptide (TPR) repeat protein
MARRIGILSRLLDAFFLVGACLSVTLSVISVSAPSFARQDEAAVLEQKVTELFAAGRFREAVPLAQRVLAINERRFGPDHPIVANSLYNLAMLYVNAGSYADAEPLYRRALAIYEKARGPTHPEVADALDNLASVYNYQGRYADAEPLYKRSLAMREKALGPDHTDVANSLSNLAWLSTTPKAATPTPSRSTSCRWRSGRRRSGPAIPTSRSC